MDDIQAIKTIYCAICGAKQGQRCQMKRSGKTLVRIHWQRRERAIAIAKQDAAVARKKESEK